MAVRFTFDAEKATETIVYLASLGIPALSKYKLCKLIVLADKHHLVRFGRTITGDRICAMDHGPVPSSILATLTAVINGDVTTAHGKTLASKVNIDRSYQYPRFAANSVFEPHSLSQTDIDSLNEVDQAHGRKTFDELKGLTHEMIAYKKAWENRTSQAPTIAFEDFFEEDDDAVAGVREETIENSALREVFPEPNWK